MNFIPPSIDPRKTLQVVSGDKYDDYALFVDDEEKHHFLRGAVWHPEELRLPKGEEEENEIVFPDGCVIILPFDTANPEARVGICNLDEFLETFFHPDGQAITRAQIMHCLLPGGRGEHE